MKTSITYRDIWKIAYPIILGSVAQNLINVTDTAFLGRVGEVALGAGAIGGIFYISAIMLAWGFGIGTQIIVARRNGEKEYARIGKTLEHAFLFLMPLALILFTIMKGFSGNVLSNVIRSDEVCAATSEFIRFRIYGFFFASFNFLFRAFYVGIARTKVITFTTSVMAVVNIFFDYSLIFGHYGLPEMGIGGAALASVIAEGSATLFFFAYTLVSIPRGKYRLFHFQKLDLTLYFRVIKVSLPIMLQNFLSLGAWFVFFLFVEKLGEKPLAISNIIRSFYMVLMIPMWGFASATNTLVSTLIGEGKPEEVWPLTFKIVRLCFFMVLSVVVIGFLFPEPALRIYTNDRGLIADSMPVLYVINLAALMLSVTFVLFNAVSGTGKTQVSFFIEFATIVVYLAATYLLAEVLKSNVAVVWIVEWIYALMLGSISYLYLRYGRWRVARI